MAFFNTSDLEVVMKYDEVLYQFISQLSYRCNFRANSVVLEQVYTSNYV